MTVSLWPHLRRGLVRTSAPFSTSTLVYREGGKDGSRWVLHEVAGYGQVFHKKWPTVTHVFMSLVLIRKSLKVSLNCNRTESSYTDRLSTPEYSHFFYIWSTDWVHNLFIPGEWTTVPLPSVRLFTGSRSRPSMEGEWRRDLDGGSYFGRVKCLTQSI